VTAKATPLATTSVAAITDNRRMTRRILLLLSSRRV
jgi:hypothetical protein